MEEQNIQDKSFFDYIISNLEKTVSSIAQSVASIDAKIISMDDKFKDIEKSMCKQRIFFYISITAVATSIIMFMAFAPEEIKYGFFKTILKNI